MIENSTLFAPLFTRTAVSQNQSFYRDSCKLFTKVIREGDYMEIPTFLLAAINVIHDRVAKIPFSTEINNYASIETGIKRTWVGNSWEIQKLFINVNIKGNTYYIAPGCILNKDYKPLLTLCLLVEKNKDYNGENCMYNLKDFIVRISPEIFVSKDIACKYILTKIVPVFVNTVPYHYGAKNRSINYNVANNKKAKILVEEFPFYAPQAKDTFTQEEIYEFLNEQIVNIDDTKELPF